MRAYRLLGLILLGLVSSGLWASEECFRLLHMPPVDRTIQPQYSVEIDSAGTITKASEKLPEFKIGHHLFLITSDGEILTSPQYDPESFLRTGKGLVTHKSMLKMYEEENFQSVAQKIVGAGEFQIGFGDVARVSNKAGNFQTDPERLSAAVDFLKHRGLPLTNPNAVAPVDITKAEDFGHTPFDRNVHEYRLQYMSMVESSPTGRKLLELYWRFYVLSRRTFAPLSGHDAIVAMFRARKVGQRESKLNVSAETFSFPFAYAYTVDGIHYGILAVMSRTALVAPVSVEINFGQGVADQIFNILQGVSFAVDDELRLDWKRLAKEFSEISISP